MFLQIFPENPVAERFRIKWDMLCAATGIPDKKPVGKFPVYQLSICLFMQFVQKPDSFICHLVSRPFNGCHRRAETFPVKIPVKPCDWYLSLERSSFYGLQKSCRHQIICADNRLWEFLPCLICCNHFSGICFPGAVLIISIIHPFRHKTKPQFPNFGLYPLLTHLRLIGIFHPVNKTKCPDSMNPGQMPHDLPHGFALIDSDKRKPGNLLFQRYTGLFTFYDPFE